MSGAPWTKAGTKDWLALQRAKGLEAAAFLVLFALTEYVNAETGEANPSLNTLAVDCHMSQPHVRRMIQKLLASNCICVVDPGKQGRGHSARYRLLRDDEAVKAHQAAVVARRAERRESYASATRSMVKGTALVMNGASAPPSMRQMAEQQAKAREQAEAEEKARCAKEQLAQIQPQHVARYAGQFRFQWPPAIATGSSLP
ncbi:helix-turn-helix domain-containing protein [Bradyrhizobium sp. HKCCYLS1011]|uniref:helix-turn-helix domain-containing protein n=1 Tax=Bradyrhizobium sp. HKCCYLS1011 TaxID=3420733 RepID=UPI003EC04AB4